MIDLRNPFVLREDLYAFDGTLIVRQGEFITQGLLDESNKNALLSQSQRPFSRKPDSIMIFRWSWKKKTTRLSSINKS